MRFEPPEQHCPEATLDRVAAVCSPIRYARQCAEVADALVVGIQASEDGVDAGHSTSPPWTVILGRIRAMMMRLSSSVDRAYDADTITCPRSRDRTSCAKSRNL